MSEIARPKLPGDYLAGFVDGEGCFAIKYRRDLKRNRGDGRIREYSYWGVEFAIVSRLDDEDLLKLVQNTLGCGKISYSRNRNIARFSIQNPKDLHDEIIPFFREIQTVRQETFRF